MEQRKQTAVEWIEDELSKLNSAVVNTEITPEEYHTQRVGLWEKAKQMEEDKIREAYYRGVRDEMQNIGKDFEDFYNETYGKE